MSLSIDHFVLVRAGMVPMGCEKEGKGPRDRKKKEPSLVRRPHREMIRPQKERSPRARPQEHLHAGTYHTPLNQTQIHPLTTLPQLHREGIRKNRACLLASSLVGGPLPLK